MKRFPSRAFLLASLKLWARRLKYRRSRLKHWKAKRNKALVAKWHHLVLAAENKVALRRRQLGQLGKATGVDVSNNNGHVDLKRVRQAGYDFVYCKATEGVSFVDRFLTGNVQAARSAGLRVGAYHFLRPGAGGSAVAEARHFAKHVKAAGLGRGDLLPVVDVEVTGFGFGQALSLVPEGSGFMGCAYNAQMSLSAKASGPTEAYVATFVHELEQLLGIKPLVYTFPAFMHWTSTHGCGLWIANFGVPAPTIPSPWGEYAIWQHTSTASVPGVPGNCDANKCPDIGAVVW